MTRYLSHHLRFVDPSLSMQIAGNIACLSLGVYYRKNISNPFWTVYEASPGSFVSVGFVHSVICQKIPVLDEFMCYSKLCCGNSFIVAKQRDSTGKLSSFLMCSILRNSINLS